MAHKKAFNNVIFYQDVNDRPMICRRTYRAR